jgi:hypothetical protein
VSRKTYCLPSVKIFVKADDTAAVGMGRRPGLRVRGVVAVGGAHLLVLIPKIAALPDAMAQAGDGADGGGVIAHFFKDDGGLSPRYMTV